MDYICNATQTIRDFRGIPKGSAPDTSVKGILDSLLYPYIAPTISYITGTDVDISSQIVSDKVVYREKATTVPPFMLSVEILVGSGNTLSCIFKKYNETTSQVDQQQLNITTTAGSTYIASVDITEFSTNCSYQIIISDGTTTIESSIITYKFIDPVYLGFCSTDVFTETDLIDANAASIYFNALIRRNNLFIYKYIGPIKNYKGFNVMDPIYANSEMHAFILYPNTLNKLTTIRDTNDIDITASFVYSDALLLSISQESTDNSQYTLYASRNQYEIQLAAMAEIQYNFIEDNATDDFGGTGTPVLAGFDVLTAVPIDYRMVVATYTDLLRIAKKYDGMVTYVISEHTFFKYSRSQWDPTNQQVFLELDATKTSDDLDLELGSWNDILINVGNGYVYQKLENRRWETKGQLNTGESGGTIGEQGPAGEAATIDIDSTITGLPGTKAKVENLGDTTNALLRFTIPQGPQGESTTISIGTVITTTSDQPAAVVNSGTSQDAILDFTIPKGLDGASASVTVGTVSDGETFEVVNSGTSQDAILDFTYPVSEKSVNLDSVNMVLSLKTIKQLEE